MNSRLGKKAIVGIGCQGVFLGIDKIWTLSMYVNLAPGSLQHTGSSLLGGPPRMYLYLSNISGPLGGEWVYIIEASFAPPPPRPSTTFACNIIGLLWLASSERISTRLRGFLLTLFCCCCECPVKFAYMFSCHRPTWCKSVSINGIFISLYPAMTRNDVKHESDGLNLNEFHI